MELRHLRYFLAVAEEGHMTRAAERLGIQQPPLSQQIKAMELALGLQLFRRKPRGMELTEAGQNLLVDARSIIAQLEQAEAKAKRTARGEQGKVVVGFTSSAPLHPFIPDVLRKFTEAYPNIELKLEELGTTELLEGLKSETVDAAFIRSSMGNTQGISIFEVLEEKMYAALPAHHPFVSSDGKMTSAPIAIKKLAHEPFILYRRHSGVGFYDLIIAACHQAGFSPDIAQEAPRILSTLSLVAAGLGVTFVPASMRALNMPGVAYLSLKSKPSLTAPINMAWRSVDHSAAARNFINLVRKLAPT